MGKGAPGNEIDNPARRLAQCEAELQALLREQEALAHGVSHDLRAPLRAIDNFAALLEGHAGPQLDATGSDYLQRIRAAAARMTTLIDALLSLSRASRAGFKPQDVDVSLLADWVGAELRDAHPHREADIEVQAGINAFGDERLLKLLLEQLMDNAWRYSKPDARVQIAVGAQRDGADIVISVHDAGIGFDMQYADRLFEPYGRLHGGEQGEGNGLGLAVAWRIVERHRGRLWVQSQVGAGSTFFIALPAATGEHGAP